MWRRARIISLGCEWALISLQCVCVAVYVYVCMPLLPQEKKVRDPGPRESTGPLLCLSLRDHQLIKETSAPVKGQIKKQGGRWGSFGWQHFTGFLRQQNSELDNETQRLSHQCSSLVNDYTWENTQIVVPFGVCGAVIIICSGHDSRDCWIHLALSNMCVCTNRKTTNPRAVHVPRV